VSATRTEAESVGSSAPAMRVDRVTKEFGGLIAVNDVSIDVSARSIASLIGPNGAGKTTLFNMLTGLYKPTAGRVLLGDRDISRTRPDRIKGLGVARTFQNIRLFGAMSAVENVMIGRHARIRAGLLGIIPLRCPNRIPRAARRAPPDLLVTGEQPLRGGEPHL
jgi:branched-chain amino acid transport system ATP-binding protein